MDFLNRYLQHIFVLLNKINNIKMISLSKHGKVCMIKAIYHKIEWFGMLCSVIFVPNNILYSFRGWNNHFFFSLCPQSYEIYLTFVSFELEAFSRTDFLSHESGRWSEILETNMEGLSRMELQFNLDKMTTCRRWPLLTGGR